MIFRWGQGGVPFSRGAEGGLLLLLLVGVDLFSLNFFRTFQSPRTLAIQASRPFPAVPPFDPKRSFSLLLYSFFFGPALPPCPFFLKNTPFFRKRHPAAPIQKPFPFPPLGHTPFRPTLHTNVFPSTGGPSKPSAAGETFFSARWPPQGSFFSPPAAMELPFWFRGTSLKLKDGQPFLRNVTFSLSSGAGLSPFLFQRKGQEWALSFDGSPQE